MQAAGEGEKEKETAPRGESLCKRWGAGTPPALPYYPFSLSRELGFVLHSFKVQQSLNLYSFLAKQYNLRPYLTSQSPSVLIFGCEDSDSMKHA